MVTTVSVSPAHRIASGRRASYLRRKSALNCVLVAPARLLSIIVVVIPGALTLLLAFTNWSGIGFNFQFVGIDNFEKILAGPVFATSLRNNITWLVLFLTLPAIIGLLTAALLLGRKKMRTFYQVIYLMPDVLAPVVNALIWQTGIYNPHGGGRRQTPGDQVEGAIVDGANGWQFFRNIYLPSIRPTLLLMGVMAVIFSFLAFDYIYLLTQGGPAHSSEVMGTYAYAFAFSSFEFGKAAAVGIIMSFFGLIASVLYTWISRRDVTK